MNPYTYLSFVYPVMLFYNLGSLTEVEISLLWWPVLESRCSSLLGCSQAHSKLSQHQLFWNVLDMLHCCLCMLVISVSIFQWICSWQLAVFIDHISVVNRMYEHKTAFPDNHGANRIQLYLKHPLRNVKYWQPLNSTLPCLIDI